MNRIHRLAVAISLLLVVLISGTALANSPTVSTDKQDYKADETVVISGSGYAGGVTLSVRVTAPDGSVLSGDGTGAPGPDLVTTDAAGAFTLSYALSGTMPDGIAYYGQEGTYTVDVLTSDGSLLATTTFKDSHFRFGHITWRLRPDIAPNAVELTVLHAWRTSAFFGSTPAIGQTLPSPTAVFNFGDSSSIWLQGTVASVNGPEDWFLARHTFTHVYPHQGPFNAGIDSCCRIFGLVNANSSSFRAFTRVDLNSGNQGSPVSSISPILQMVQGGVNTLPLSIADPDGDPFTCRLASSGESSIPSNPTAAGLPLSVSSTCVLSWDTSGTAVGQLWAAQVMIEENHGGNISPVVLDFIIRIVDGTINQAPSCTLNGNTSNVVAVGHAFTISATGTDPDGGDLTINHLGLPSGATLNPAAGSSGPQPLTTTFSWTPTAADAGSAQAVTFVFADPGGLSSTCSFSIQVPRNQPPTADAGGPYNGDEGSAIALTGTASDPDNDALSVSWSYAPDPIANDVDAGATCSFDNPGALSTNFTCTDDGTYVATLTVSDSTNPAVSDDTAVTVANVAPAVGTISAPVDPVAVNTSISINAPYSDAGANDTHTASIDWGDGSTSAGTAGTETASGDHTYTAAGVYTVELIVTDDDGGSGSSIYQYIVVYDPDAGFVTGGGWIDSPAGAYADDLSLSGKANFGFVSKYKKGATTPDGQTQFQFHAAGFNFHSTVYEWLVISGPKAQYKGSGTVNGSGDYGFMLTANDGQVNGGGDVDKFRLKVWDKASGAIIYDNQVGDSDDAVASDEIESGSIVIHSGK